MGRNKKTQKKLKILLLFDLLENPPEDQDFSKHLILENLEWKNETHVLLALKRLGHDVKPFGVYKNLGFLLKELQENKPDLVFNLLESFEGNREHEPHMAGILELFKVKYTGAGPTSLAICKDKGLTKKILSFHRIKVPKFTVSSINRPIQGLKNFKYPAFIKPLGLEGSDGIAQASFVNNEKDGLERIKFIHDSLKCNAIIEEYIEGRELYISVLGNHRLNVFPPREIFFNEIPDGTPKIATFKAKWDEEYRKKWGIKNGPAKELPPELSKKIASSCKRIYRLLKIKGYGRIDLRLNDNGDFFFIEANPNPAIASDEDFGKSAQKGGLTYDELIKKIISLSGVRL